MLRPFLDTNMSLQRLLLSSSPRVIDSKEATSHGPFDHLPPSSMLNYAATLVTWPPNMCTCLKRGHIHAHTSTQLIVIFVS